MSDKTKDELKNEKDKKKIYRNIGIIVGIIFIIGCVSLNSFTKKSLYFIVLSSKIVLSFSLSSDIIPPVSLIPIYIGKRYFILVNSIELGLYNSAANQLW